MVGYTAASMILSPEEILKRRHVCLFGDNNYFCHNFVLSLIIVRHTATSYDEKKKKQKKEKKKKKTELKRPKCPNSW